MEISRFFLHYPWKFHFFSWPCEISVCSFFNTPRNSMNSPLWHDSPRSFLIFQLQVLMNYFVVKKECKKVPKLWAKRQAYLLIDCWKWSQVFNESPIKTPCSLEKSINIWFFSFQYCILLPKNLYRNPFCLFYSSIIVSIWLK